MREVVSENGGQRGVEGGGEGRSAEAGAQVGVVAGFDGQDSAGGGQEGGVGREGCGAANIRAYADAVQRGVLVSLNGIVRGDGGHAAHVVIMLARETKDLGSVEGNL